MFKAKIKAGILREFFKKPECLVEEFKLKVSANGLNVLVLDPAHVAMLDAKLDVSAFESFECNEATEIFIALVEYPHTKHQGGFKSIFKSTRPTDIIEMEFPIVEKIKPSKPKDALEFERTFLRVKYNGIERDFVHDPNNLDALSNPEWPKLNLANKFAIKVFALKRILSEIGSASDHMAIVMQEKGVDINADIEFDVEHYIKTRVHQFFKVEDLDGFFIKKQENVTDPKYKAMYPIDYMEMIANSMAPASPVTIEFDHNYPANILFDITHLHNIVGGGSFLLAPRIEDD